MPEARVIPLHRPSGRTTEFPGSQAAELAELAAQDRDEPRWYRDLADLLAFVARRMCGDYAVDEFGFDPDLTEHMLLPLLRPLYRNWFRVETIGIRHLPAEGGALVVANHSGTLPLDALMTAVAVHEVHPAGRHLRILAADLVFRTPLLGSLARKSGQTLACVPDAERLLASGELVGVWPEGFKGVGKRYRDRYKLQRFGRGGFVSTALRTQTPIVPCAIVGAEEIYPMIGDIKHAGAAVKCPILPRHTVVPAVRAGGDDPATVQVVHRIR